MYKRKDRKTRLFYFYQLEGDASGNIKIGGTPGHYLLDIQKI